MFKFWFVFHVQIIWQSFIRDNSFLQTPSQSLIGKQKNPSPRNFRHINNITAVLCIFLSILNCSKENRKNSIISSWKCRSKGLLKAIFCHQKSNKKPDRFCMKFSSTSNIVHELVPKIIGIWLRRIDKT